ncbi:unnamed protein product [Adineta steineri]|uniref:Uncharacterized protein n=1 Tax=Adineta steineri TaxID=433720 RepID=A0A819J313_9BILA|nr:unnamed protein product [Adineta steineri]
MLVYREEIVQMPVCVQYRKLKPKKTKFSSIQSKTSVNEYWLKNIRRGDNPLFSRLSEKYESLYTIANGPHTDLSSNAILESFLWAYYRHHDIVLSPDDMWLLVCMFFAQHVNDNAEQLRSNFVEHNEGKITLTTCDFNDKYDWDDFFDQMKKEVVQNTKNNICQLLTADFSTTGKSNQSCTLNDWQSLRIKTEQLKLFSNDQFHGYLNGVLSIFDQFIETYKGNVNHNFWIKVCDVKRKTIADINPCAPFQLSLFPKRIPIEKLTRWVVQLFGLEEFIVESDEDDSILPYIYTPVEFLDGGNGTSDQCHIVGGFHGIYSTENRYKPVMSVSVIQMLKSKTQNQIFNEEDCTTYL